jgi:hypothetical protein
VQRRIVNGDYAACASNGISQHNSEVTLAWSDFEH